MSDCTENGIPVQKVRKNGTLWNWECIWQNFDICSPELTFLNDDIICQFMDSIFENCFQDVSLKVKGYKCFSSEAQGFDIIQPINIIIGRNNTGKTTLIELVNYAVKPASSFLDLKHGGKHLPEVLINMPLTESVLSKVFPMNVRGGNIREGNHWQYGSKWIGKRLTYSLKLENTKTFVDLDPPFDSQAIQDEFNQKIVDATPNPFNGKIFKHLLAERDIVAESENDAMHLVPNGSGATNILRRYINISSLPRELVEEKLLAELNKIFNPDSHYQGITTRTGREGTQWEIFLQEKNKGRISLSHTGSGFKTILLVLMFLQLVPNIEGKPLHDYIFAFEELENNLHPALQRRLLLYLRDFVLNNGCTLFLTTHSNIEIDMFSRDDKAQIIHVTHDGQEAFVRRAQTYVDNRGILDDLDVRASDLLQANSIIWVEGPSDRLYVNRWIELWTGGNLKEGVHYQCMFYGGRLLAHLSANVKEGQNIENPVAILRLNKNAAIIIDSDKESAKGKINDTKTRIRKEIEDIGGIAWITNGKEIENYLPTVAITQLYSKSGLPILDKYEDFAEYLEKNVSITESVKFEKGKTQFAANICPRLTKDNIQNVLDISDNLNLLCNKIKEWNNIPLQTVT